QPMSPIESDGTYYAAGFGTDVPNALVLHVIDANSIGLSEANTIDGKAYPNPANDNITLSIEGEGAAIVVVTDVAGKVVSNQSLILVNGAADYSLEGILPTPTCAGPCPAGPPGPI
ncbi:MAG: T9SS type A sorting domain-containing protein, partial [Cyanobium sp.]